MWSLKDIEKGELKPKVFSNGKSQQDVVEEVLKSMEEGYKIIFVKGVCGSGKSAIALNIAKEIGKTSIIVPIKNLQRQYEQDYMKKKEIFKDSGEKLKISMITGRNNHHCPYLKENKQEIQETRKKEVNANLFDVIKSIQKKSSGEKEEIEYDESADNKLVPCKIEIKEKNLSTLKKYHRENKESKDNSNLDFKYMKRMAVGPACKYWAPILPENLKVNLEAEKKNYESVSGTHSIYVRTKGCPYYDQFLSYLDSDVIIFNNMQYLLETSLGRKPATEVEIIDECDEFLDKLAAEGNINLNRLMAEAKFLYGQNEEQEKLVRELINEVSSSMSECKNKSSKEEIYKLKETKFLELVKLVSKNDYLPIIQDEDSYLEQTMNLCRKFQDLIDESYVSFYKIPERNEYGVKLVTINLEKMFNSLVHKNKSFVLMSGTLHSEKVLKEIFGIRRFKIIEAEGINQGNITKKETGLERDFKYANFSNGNVTREEFLIALDRCVEISEKPSVVHVNAFSDLPNEREIEEFRLKHLISSDKLREMQIKDKEGRLINEFKKGEEKTLFTTRCSRGVDFPYEECNSTIITKFPYPNTKSLFWKILQRQKPNFFWDFYKDKAHRELLQRIYRSVRAVDDKVNLYSPDKRILDSEVI